MPSSAASVVYKRQVYHDTNDSDTDAVLKGVVRVSLLEDAWEHIPDVVARVKPDYLRRAYKVQSWESPEDFLQQVARLTGRLLKGGEPDLNTAAKMVLYDWQRGRIPFFAPPPQLPEQHVGVEFAHIWDVHQVVARRRRRGCGGGGRRRTA